MVELLNQLNIKPALLLSQIAGFVILFWILKRFMFGPIARILEEREQKVREHLERAEREREAMTRSRAEYDQRLAQIEAEARDRIQQAIQQANAIREEIVQQARSEGERILARSRAEIEHEKQKALVELRDRMAELAVLGAQKVIESSLDEASHRRLVRSFLEELETRQ